MTQEIWHGEISGRKWEKPIAKKGKILGQDGQSIQEENQDIRGDNLNSQDNDEEEVH